MFCCSAMAKFWGFFSDRRPLVDGFMFVGVLLRMNFCGLGGKSPERVIMRIFGEALCNRRFCC